MQITLANVDVLRQGWSDAVNSIAPEADDVAALLADRLEEATHRNTLEEEPLLRIVDEASHVAARVLPPITAMALSRRLQRAVYEYLLSLDAAAPEEPPAAPPTPIAADSDLIGAEEIAELSGHQSSPEVPEAVETGAGPAGEAPTSDAEPADVPIEEPARRDRFMVFRRTESPALEPVEAAHDAEVTPAAEVAAPAQPPEPAPPAESEQPSSEQPSFVAPRDGFHLTDHSHFEEPAPAMPADEPAPGPSSRGWRVRSLRRGQRGGDAQRPERDPGVADPDADADEETPAEALFDNDPQAIAIRRQIDDRLRKRRCDEAASLMQRLAAEFGGRPVADLGLDAGDRCRALGKHNAALSCYVAATRADPVYEEPLLRLADVCLGDRDVDLAVSYLERVARLHRMRDDHKGAIRVYRKIATIAPNREDILSVLMRAQASGRFDD